MTTNHSGDLREKLAEARRLTHAKRAKILRLEARIKDLEAEINYWRDESIFAGRQRDEAIAELNAEIERRQAVEIDLEAARKAHDRDVAELVEAQVRLAQSLKEIDALKTEIKISDAVRASQRESIEIWKSKACEAEKREGHWINRAREVAGDLSELRLDSAFKISNLKYLCIIASVWAGAATGLAMYLMRH